MVERGMDVNATEVGDTYGQRPLSWAALHGRLAVVTYLVSVGANLNAVDFFGDTPLHNSCRCQNGRQLVEIVRFLVSSGANINFQNNQGSTPLYYAVRAGSSEMVTSLIDSNALVNVTQLYIRNSPLSTALRRKDDDNRQAILTTLVNAGAKATAPSLAQVMDAPTRSLLEDLVRARDSHAIPQEINAATALPAVLGELVTEYALALGWEENAYRLMFS
jgi:ankyrin repeat protein